MIGTRKIVLEYFWVAHGKLYGGNGTQAKDSKYVEVNQMKTEWQESVQIEVAACAKVKA